MSQRSADAVGLRNAVRSVLRHASRTAIIPRFRQLRRSDVSEKSPGEWVTVADQESEAILGEGLLDILPSARMVGEEGSSADSGLLESLDRGLIWIVDPLDGTANFASGHEPFGVIVALADNGETLAGWLYDPVTDRLCFTALGYGADLSVGDSEPRKLKVPADPDNPIATLATQFMAPQVREAVIARGEAAFDLRPIPRCAAEHYPRLCQGEYHVALFHRTLPWDHAAGALLLTEAGGHVARWDGSPYRFHEKGSGMLATSSRRLWDEAAAALLDGLEAGGGDLMPADVKIPQLRD